MPMIGDLDVTNLKIGVFPGPLYRGGYTDPVNTGNLPIVRGESDTDDSTMEMLNCQENYGYVVESETGLLRCDGSNDEFDTTTTMPITNASKFTLAIWAYADDITANNFVYGQFQALDDRVYLTFQDTSVNFTTAKGGVFAKAISDGALIQAGWNFIVARKDGSALSLRVNGQAPTYTQNNSYDLGNICATAPVVFGYAGNKAGAHYAGRFGSILLLDDAISDARCDAIYDMGYDTEGLIATDNGDGTATLSVPSGAGFDATLDGEQVTLIDYSRNGNNQTILYTDSSNNLKLKKKNVFIPNVDKTQIASNLS